MKKMKKFWLYLLAGFIGLCALEPGQQFGVPGVPSLISAAKAVVGRSATPVSVGGVARRSVRR